MPAFDELDGMVLGALTKEDGTFQSAGQYFSCAERFIHPGQKNDALSVDFGQVAPAVFKWAYLQLNEVIPLENSDLFVDVFTHSPKHTLGLVKRLKQGGCGGFDDPIVREYAEAMRDATLSIKDFYGAHMAYDVLGSPEDSKKAVELSKEKIQRIKDYPDDMTVHYTDSDVVKCKTILQSYLEKFERHPWSTFDIDSYILKQKQQWQELKGFDWTAK